MRSKSETEEIRPPTSTGMNPSPHQGESGHPMPGASFTSRLGSLYLSLSSTDFTGIDPDFGPHLLEVDELTGLSRMGNPQPKQNGNDCGLHLQ